MFVIKNDFAFFEESLLCCNSDEDGCVESPWDKSGGNLPLTAGYNRHSEYRWSQKPKTFTKEDCILLNMLIYIKHLTEAFSISACLGLVQMQGRCVFNLFAGFTIWN